jgi:hypothetical protein
MGKTLSSEMGSALDFGQKKEWVGEEQEAPGVLE